MILSLVVIALLSACRNDFDFEEHYSGGEIKKEYADNWVKQMGPIDPNQDWCMAGEYHVTVDVPGEEDVKVYSLESDGVYQLVGEYFGVSGLQNLTFDAEKGTERLLVTIGENSYKTLVNCSVPSTNLTRAVISGSNVSAIDDNTIHFNNTDIENCISKVNGIFAGWTKGTPNYKYIPQSREIYIYPMYWETTDPLIGSRYTDEIGLYYTDSRGKEKTIPVFNTSTGDNLQYKDSKGNWINCSANDSYNKSAQEYKAKGIKVSLPDDCNSFGLYIKNRDNIFYTENSRNDGVLVKTKCGVFTYNNDSYISLGDAFGSGIDDVIFRIEGVSTVNETLNSWYLVCEDLGDTGDYDFNDIVLKFKKDKYQKKEGGKTTTKYTLSITPLAAGGTLSAVCNLDGVSIGEIHELLGVGILDSQGCYKMINTNAPQGQGVDGKNAETWVKEYDTDFSISSELKKFTIEVGTENPIIISSPEKGSAPQMIIVPDTWQWPSERTSILDAYPNFTDWSSDKTNTDWSSHKANDPDRVFFYYAPNK